MSKSLRLPREKHFEPQKTSRDPGVLTILPSESLSRRRGRLQLPKVVRDCQFLTILTSKSLSRADVVQILASATSKSVPAPSVFNDFGFRILLARRRGANFVAILSSRSSATPVFRTYLQSDKTMEKHSISRSSYPPNPHVSHIYCITSARSHFLVDRSSAATLSIVGSLDS